MAGGSRSTADMPEVACRPDHGGVVPNRRASAVGDRLHREHGRRAPARIALEQQRLRPASVDRPALPQHGGERLGIAEAEIDALPGERMHAMRGVADQRDAMRDDRRQLQERERETRR